MGATVQGGHLSHFSLAASAGARPVKGVIIARRDGRKRQTTCSRTSAGDVRAGFWNQMNIVLVEKQKAPHFWSTQRLRMLRRCTVLISEKTENGSYKTSFAVFSPLSPTQRLPDVIICLALLPFDQDELEIVSARNLAGAHATLWGCSRERVRRRRRIDPAIEGWSCLSGNDPFFLPSLTTDPYLFCGVRWAGMGGGAYL